MTIPKKLRVAGVYEPGFQRLQQSIILQPVCRKQIAKWRAQLAAQRGVSRDRR